MDNSQQQQPHQIYPFNNLNINPNRNPTMQTVAEHAYADRERVINEAEHRYSLNDFERLITLGIFLII